MMWVLAGVTTLVLGVIALGIKDISKPPTAARPAALSASVRPAQRAGPSAALRPKPSASTSQTTSRRTWHITDSGSGLYYRLLSSPWRRGCPDALNTPMFSWSAGEHAVAGLVSGAPWYGNACSGPAYYSGLQHSRTIEDSSAMLVSGHQAWEVTFQVTYSDAAGQGLAFDSEDGAVVVVDRGAGQVPAVFYASVPSNLGTSDVRILIGSLRLAT